MVHLQQFTRAPRQPTQIFKGERRKHVISQIIDVLDNFRLSRFENEASIRSGVRSALCLAGHGWHPSDSEAAALLATAFTKMGVHRPSWFEGQREYTIPRQNCARCGCDLDEESIGNRDRFCSEMCRSSAKRFSGDLYRYNAHAIYDKAFYLAERAAAPERACKTCARMFRSAMPNAIHCSNACVGVAKRTRDRDRTCLRCETPFIDRQGPNRPQRYCSVECRRAGHEVEKTCDHCSAPFWGSNPKSRFCSKVCKNTSSKRKRLADAMSASEFQTQAETEPSTEFQTLATVLRHPALSVEAFDALFHPPRRPTLAEQLAKSFGGARAFAMEGELVRELRVRFIEEGKSWADAQAEAERTVEEAIQIAGLERPRSTIAGGYRLSLERRAVR